MGTLGGSLDALSNNPPPIVTKEGEIINCINLNGPSGPGCRPSGKGCWTSGKYSSITYALGQAARQGCDPLLSPVGRRLKQLMGPMDSALSESWVARVVQSGAQERLVAEWDKRH